MSGGTRVRSGKIVAANANLDIDSVGFLPSRVVVENYSNQCKIEWVNTLADGEGFKTVANGTRTTEATTGVTPRTDGFRLGAEADINDTTTEILHWVAWE